MFFVCFDGFWLATKLSKTTDLAACNLTSDPHAIDVDEIVKDMLLAEAAEAEAAAKAEEDRWLRRVRMGSSELAPMPLIHGWWLYIFSMTTVRLGSVRFS